MIEVPNCDTQMDTELRRAVPVPQSPSPPGLRWHGLGTSSQGGWWTPKNGRFVSLSQVMGTPSSLDGFLENPKITWIITDGSPFLGHLQKCRWFSTVVSLWSKIPIYHCFFLLIYKFPTFAACVAVCCWSKPYSAGWTCDVCTTTCAMLIQLFLVQIPKPGQ